MGSNTSDLAELLGGLLHVRVATPDSPDSVMEDGHLSASDRVRPEAQASDTTLAQEPPHCSTPNPKLS